MKSLVSNKQRILRYGLVGGSAFVLEFALFNLMVANGFGLILAQTMSFITGLIISFLGSRYFTFANGDAYAVNAKVQFAGYSVLALFNLIASNILILFIVEKMILGAVVAKILVMIMIVTWNFLIFNRVIFRPGR